MILWLNPVAGLSGDMLLAALVDLGAPLDAISEAVASTGLTGWRTEMHEVSRAGLRAVHLEVVAEAPPSHGRPAAELIELVAKATPAPVADMAGRALLAMATAEAKLHGTTVETVHLHELSGIDTVVDLVGVAAAVHLLGVSEVWSAPVALGTGTVHAAHGLLPVPAPATLALLADAQVHSIGPVGETVTPTGAALLQALGTRYGDPGPMQIVATGYGAGTRDPEHRPNVLPAVLATPVPSDSGETDTLVELETTLDDVTGEIVAHTLARVLDAGALDAWAVHTVGKKGRPALVLTVLCAPALTERLVRLVAAETGTLGVRWHCVSRRALPRTAVEVRVGDLPVRVKVGPHYAKPEYEDVSAAAVALGLSARAVAEQALTLAQIEHPEATEADA